MYRKPMEMDISIVRFGFPSIRQLRAGRGLGRDKEKQINQWIEGICPGIAVRPAKIEWFALVKKYLF